MESIVFTKFCYLFTDKNKLTYLLFIFIPQKALRFTVHSARIKSVQHFLKTNVGIYLFSKLPIAKLSTLTCQIIMQDHLIVQVADLAEINKRVGLNKAVQEGFFLIYVGENQVLKEKMSKINKRVDANKVVQVFFFPEK